MNDGTEYAEMLKTMVSTCDVVVKPAKRKRKKSAKPESEPIIPDNVSTDRDCELNDAKDDFVEIDKHFKKHKKAEYRADNGNKPKFKFDIVYAEGITVFLLAVGILLTNIFWENSGINTVFKNVFSPAEVSADARSYSSFNAKCPSDTLNSSVEDGVMIFSGKGALYPVCDGKVTSIVEEDGKYTITVSHSGVFKTVVSGADFVYCEKGDEVFKYIPVCYVNGGEAKVYMYNEDVLVTNYVVENGSIVWSV